MNELSTPLFVVALEPQTHAASGKFASKGFLRFDWPDRGVCVALFTTEAAGRQFLTRYPPLNCAGLYIRDPQELADILETCRTDGDAQWAAVDPLELSVDSHCVPIQDAIEALLKQARDDQPK